MSIAIMLVGTFVAALEGTALTDWERVVRVMAVIFQERDPTVGQFNELFEPGDEGEVEAVWRRVCGCPEDSGAVAKCHNVVNEHLLRGEHSRSEFLAEVRERTRGLMQTSERLCIEPYGSTVSGLRRYRIRGKRFEVWISLLPGDKFIELVDVRVNGRSALGRCVRYP